MGTTPIKGKADYLELGTWNAACWICGRKFKANTMIKLPPAIGGPWGGNTYVCPRDYRSRQPQDLVRGIPDNMSAPWQQPEIDLFIGACGPNNISAVPGYASPACAVPGYLSPIFDDSIDD